MSTTSINVTRISTNQQSYSLLESLRRNQLSMYLTQNQLASGNRLNAPSDDPVAAGQALNLTQALERQNQIVSNIQFGSNFLSASDDAMSSMNDLLTQAKSIASEMATTTESQASRDSQAELVKGILQEMVRTGNRQFNGVYLFGGTRTTQPPFIQTDSGGVSYVGDLTNIFTQIDQDAQTQVNLNGADLFSTVSGQVQGYVDLNPAISTDTRLADLKGFAGSGIQKGLIRIDLTSPATGFVVDLRTADTVGDVISAMNNAAAQAGLTVGSGGDFNATLNGTLDGLSLDAAAGNVSVTQVGQGFTARDLGLLGASGGSLTGGDLQSKLTLTTPVSTLFGGSGASLGQIQITSGAKTQTIDLSGAATVQDILNTINSAGLDVRASINSDGSGINVVNTASGVAMSIGEAGGNTASLLGIRSLSDGTLLSSLNGGKGIQTVGAGQPDIRIVAKDGSNVDVSLNGVLTVQDVLDRINTAAGTAGVAINASLASTGNGIQITDSTGGSAGELHVERLNQSYAIDQLGLNKSADTAGGTVLTGTDTNTIKPDSVFTALQDLYDALKKGDSTGITDAGGRVDSFITSVSRMRGIVGARSQAMDTRLNLTQDAVTATQKLLSNIKDVDFTEAITRFQQAQTTLQANLLTGSKMMQMSLLDFLGTG